MAIEKYEVVIGCEIHTQLLTKTKAFCACENRYGGMPNTRVCPVCLGLPGAMPRISKGYVELGAVAGHALNCKHYFYPDLAKGYQITQYDIPLCSDGYVDLPLNHYSKDEQPGGPKCRDKNFKGDNSTKKNIVLTLLLKIFFSNYQISFLTKNSTFKTLFKIRIDVKQSIIIL